MSHHDDDDPPPRGLILLGRMDSVVYQQTTAANRPRRRTAIIPLPELGGTARRTAETAAKMRIRTLRNLIIALAYKHGVPQRDLAAVFGLSKTGIVQALDSVARFATDLVSSDRRREGAEVSGSRETIEH